MDSIKNFFVARKVELIVFLLLLLVAIFSGINFGIILGLTLFYWAASYVADIPKGGRTLANISRFVIFIVFLFSLIGALMPRTNSQLAILWDKVDQISYHTGNTAEVTARDLWETQRDNNSKEFLEYYNQLLADGETKEAADTLAKFQKAWDLEEQRRQSEGNYSNSSASPESTPAPVVTNPTPTPAPTPVVTAPPAAQNGQLTSSIVVLKPRPEPYNIAVPHGLVSGQSYRIPGNCIYDVASPGTMKFKILYTDGDISDFTDGNNHKLPKKTLATFNLQNCDNCDMTISVLVTGNPAICQK